MTPDARHITILLCTFNGARFLSEQLDSYLAQTHDNWSLWVSDDGSHDATLEILERFRRDHAGRREIRILKGPGRGGAVTNFLSLLCHPDLPVGYVALSDQDDVWLPHKLERALSQIPAATDEMLLYSAQSRYIDDAGRLFGRSIPPPGAPVFSTAVLQNVMVGHSMVLNPAAHACARRAGVPPQVAYHDWWLTILITACGGRAILDRSAVTHYRQHGANVLGAPGSFRASLLRARHVLSRDYGNWVAHNLRALLAVSHLLRPEHLEAARAFLGSPAQSGLARVRLLRRLNFHRQSRSGRLYTRAAAFLGRL